MKLLHTSDWHIGRIFNQHSLLEDQEHVLNQIIDYAQEQQVDAMIVAGDIYDRALPSADAVALLDQTLTTIISELAIPVIMISGNHDGAQRLGFGSQLLKHSGLHLFTSFDELLKPVELDASFGKVVIWGIPYCDPESVNDYFGVKTNDHQSAQEHVTNLLKQHISEHYDDTSAQVVISHSFIAGANTSESERPLSIGGAECVDADLFKDFDYTALGHLHQAQFKGYKHVRYSGSPLKYSFSEVKQKKSVTLVSFAEDKSVQVELLPLRAIRDVQVLEGKFDELLAAGKTAPNAQDYIQIKLTDKEAILDPLARLRSVYPNILDLTKLALEREATDTRQTREQLGRKPIEVISDFYKAMTTEPLSEEQENLLASIMDDVNKAAQKA
ncbi:exonuclease SbcCD subunit D [Pseudidiomarina terrestris]|uniref:exonuclease SbcCD subunit D n=1 Tax=Pseudidiomarina terrestris TaxID=2820060 RepID=UPI00264B7ADE|nr:exonuclease SbcCD subunit D [Pseudidiomarina sp. 1ASP75-5]MDN7135353.1 exonuclease SbcCD subunit D [Pseudidiomarina sp. 1ASP75-5]